MDKFEKLVNSIMADAEKDGEPVTREEAEEMAKMELNANKNCKRYEKTEKERKKTAKVRKVDEEKKHLLSCIENLLVGMSAEIIATKTETEIDFTYKDNTYSVKLIKHRPPKK